MTKGKKWTLRLLGVAALALLICLCLLGSTMARYTSTGNGEGSLTVALWDVESQKETISGEYLSPSKDDYSSTAARTNQSHWMQALTMTNNSDVKADVTVTLAEDEDGNANIGMTWAADFEWGTGWTGSTGLTSKAQTNEYAQGIMAKFGFSSDDATAKASFISLVNTAGIFSLVLAEDDSGTNQGSTLTISGIDENNGTAAVYCEVVWTSIYSGTSGITIPDGFKAGTTATDKEWEEFSDAVDTILGMYVTELSFDITWTAVQASVQPTT